MAKNSDSVWALVGGVFLGALIGGISVAVYTVESSKDVAQAELIDIESSRTLPFLEESDDINPVGPPTATELTVNKFKETQAGWKTIAADLFGREVHNSESTLSLEAELHLKDLKDANDALTARPSTILLAYTTAAHTLGYTVTSLETFRTAWAEDQKFRSAQMKILENEVAHWKHQAQQSMTEAEYSRSVAQQNREIAEHNRIAAEHARTAAAQATTQAQKNAQIAAEARAASLAAIAAATPTPTETSSERPERNRRQFPPPPIDDGIEIHNGRAFGADGNFMNITRQGSRILIEP
jgi:hypothetical protein